MKEKNTGWLVFAAVDAFRPGTFALMAGLADVVTILGPGQYDLGARLDWFWYGALLT